MSVFELRSLPDGRDNPRLFLIQLPTSTSAADAVEVPTTVAALEKSSVERARRYLEPLLDGVMRAGPGEPGGLAGEPPALGEKAVTVELDEQLGLRLSLIFPVVGPLRSEEKIEALIEGVTEMDEATLLHWSRLSTQSPEAARQALTTFLLEQS